MEWVLRSPEIHNTFSNLGHLQKDGYYIKETCNEALEKILHNILTEDKYLRTYRRSIRLGQNIEKDLIPLLIHAKEDTTKELLIRILVDLTIPLECLLCLEVISKNDFGRHTIFEISNLLTSTKSNFTDNRATKAVIDFLKKNLDYEQKGELSPAQCSNISSSLLLIRNILHIPGETSNNNVASTSSSHTIQNQIIWNIFSQSIDKVLIKLMIIPQANKWAVTMVQLIALLYKDQHIVTLQKLLNLWLEASLSESSEDNESNTSPADRDCRNSSGTFNFDATSDSSDTGASGKKNDDESRSNNKGRKASSAEVINVAGNQTLQASGEKKSDAEDKNTCLENSDVMKSENEKDSSCSSGVDSKLKSVAILAAIKKAKQKLISENSNCGYATQIENQESISTSSNDELPAKRPAHQKPHNTKQRVNNKVRSGVDKQEKKRKRIIRRGRANIINVQGLSLKTPTDDDIANILKGFTIDFLLKGYNSLVRTLHIQILTNVQLEIDTSHFFWLVTYFLKFATQIELNVEHLSSVLSFDIVSYLTSEGVNLCEQFELAVKLDSNNLKPCIRRTHLVVTAVREIIQAIEVYRKFSHLGEDKQNALVKLNIEMCNTEELRCLFLLLLRHYNPKFHCKQYLQDLVVTNHIFLMFLDSVIRLPQYNGNTNLKEHIKQFATTDMMKQYGLLLEDYSANGEFVNDCVFTMMHHVGGELDSLMTLFQPRILKTFTEIWKSDFEICDDWSDLIEYVINTFIKKPNVLLGVGNGRPDKDSSEDSTTPILDEGDGTNADVIAESEMNQTLTDTWTQEELSSLNWNYMQCSYVPDVVGEIINLYKEDDIIKSRDSVIVQLLKQNLIDMDEYEKLIKIEKDRNIDTTQISKEMRDEEIKKICEELAQAGKSEFLTWLQKVLLDTCYAKICVEQKRRDVERGGSLEHEIKSMNVGQSIEISNLSPIAYHSLVIDQSVPLVPWNCMQASVCKDLKFLQLLHKLGLQMPVDTGKMFIRIPAFWSTEYLYEIASKIMPIDHSKLKFSIDDTSAYNNISNCNYPDIVLPSEYIFDIDKPGTSDNYYQIHKQRLTNMVNYTPIDLDDFRSCHTTPAFGLHLFNYVPGSALTPDTLGVGSYNWMELVQKSQEINITLNVDNKVTGAVTVVQTDIVMKESVMNAIFDTPMIMAASTPQPSSSTGRPNGVFPDSS